MKSKLITTGVVAAAAASTLIASSKIEDRPLRPIERHSEVAAAPIAIHKKHRAPGDKKLPEIYGCVIYADGWTTDNNAMGMYQIPTSPDMEFRRLSDVHIDASSGGVLVGDTYWTCYFVDFLGSPMSFILAYDPETWEEKNFLYGEIPVISTGVVYDRETDKIYGCFRNDSNTGYVFGYVNYETVSRTKICDLPRMWSAVSINRQGEIFAIDELGALYGVDKRTGDMTLVGNTGLVASHPSSACIDPRTGTMYYALTANGTDGSLYEVNVTTAESSLVYHFPQNEEVVGLYIKTPDAEDGAPDAVSDLSLSFPNGSLEGTVSFTMPGTTFDGVSGSGSVSYIIEANGDVVVENTSDWGENVNATVTLPAAAEYNFAVYAKNDVGKAPAVEESLYVGRDYPVTPDVKLSRDGLGVTLSWDAVTSSTNGGYVDYANLKYRVVRQPDNKVVANDITETTVTDLLPAGGDLRYYTYTVTAGYGDVVSAPYVSDNIWTGAVTPAWDIVFDSALNTGGFTAIDANGDGIPWSWSEEDKAFRTYFNRSSNNDDWLVTPAIRLEAGKVYEFKAALRTYNGNPEYAEIFWGDAPTVAGLSHELLPRTQIKSRTPVNYTGYLTPETDGEYYVGIHSVTPSLDSWYLYVDEMHVSAGVLNAVPTQPCDLAFAPDYNGAKKVEISLTAPSVSDNGAALTSLDKIEVMRDDKVVKIFNNPVPGAKLTFTDDVPAAGYYTYYAVAYNEYGRGKQAEGRVFVGVNTPGKPAWAKVQETDTPGEVTVSWQPVDTAEDGSPMNPALIRYDIVTVDDTHDGEAYNVAEGVEGNSITFMAEGASKSQLFVYYAVKAVTETGYSLMTLTPFTPVGLAYEMPYKESFAYGHASTLMLPENTGSAMWSIYTDDSGIPANDGDKGMAAMFSDLSGASARLYSGKISLRNAVSPMLTFYTYNITGDDEDMNELEVLISNGGDFKSAKKIVISDLGKADGWYPVMIPLDEYVGKEVRFCFEAVTRNRKYTLVDNISVTSAKKSDLKAGLITASSTVNPGVDFVIEAGVENVGTNVAENYSVSLILNDEEVEELLCEPLEPGKTEIVRFSYRLNASMPELNTMMIRVNYDADTNTSNNESAVVSVKLVFEPLPQPQTLKGNALEDGTELEWGRPDVENAAPDAIVEDFESYESWAKSEVGAWTLIDGDNVGIGAIQNMAFPGIEYNSKLAWFVLDDTHPGLDEAYSAHSGNKYLSTMFCLPPGDFNYIPNDDWMISPMLYGGEQTISFWARSANAYEVPESFEILYSDKDSTNPADFKVIDSVDAVEGVWTKYEFRLPEGAVRFAIRYNKTYGIMLHVDDVKYIPAGKSNLTLKGYNVYRDNQLLNDEPITATTYRDEYVCNQDTRYAVSAVYSDHGESKACEELVLNVNDSGVEFATSVDIAIRVDGNRIVIEGAEGETAEIFDLQARRIAATKCSHITSISVDKGIYIVKAGAKVAKIHVR